MKAKEKKVKLDSMGWLLGNVFRASPDNPMFLSLEDVVKIAQDDGW